MYVYLSLKKVGSEATNCMCRQGLASELAKLFKISEKVMGHPWLVKIMQITAVVRKEKMVISRLGSGTITGSENTWFSIRI